MTNTRRSRAELEELLAEQRAFLKTSMSAYDAGQEHEAKRLAHTIRVLLYDTDHSTSLLRQLGIKETLQYWSMLPAGPALAPSLGIPLQMEFREGRMRGRYAPNLGQPEWRMSFADWWESEPIIVSNGGVITRQRAVLDLAHKHGGSHVDPAPTALELTLMNTDFMGWKKVMLIGGRTTVVKAVPLPNTNVVARVVTIDGASMVEEPSELKSPLRPLLRQVAHELEGTLREGVDGVPPLS